MLVFIFAMDFLNTKPIQFSYCLLIDKLILCWLYFLWIMDHSESIFIEIFMPSDSLELFFLEQFFKKLFLFYHWQFSISISSYTFKCSFDDDFFFLLLLWFLLLDFFQLEIIFIFGNYEVYLLLCEEWWKLCYFWDILFFIFLKLIQIFTTELILFHVDSFFIIFVHILIIYFSQQPY